MSTSFNFFENFPSKVYRYWLETYKSLSPKIQQLLLSDRSQFKTIDSLKRFWLKLSYYCWDNYKTLRERPRWFLMVKLTRFHVIRSLMASCYQDNLKLPKIEKARSLFKSLKVEDVVESIKNDGYYLGLQLPKKTLQEIMRFVNSSVCYANRDPELSFYYAEKQKAEAKYGQPFQLASYDSTDRICPAVKKLETDPVLLAIAAKYLGAQPVHLGSRLWWSFPVEATPLQRCIAAQAFHYDLDDYRFIKFFFYLTDVDLSSGPHICIRGSHKKKKFLHQLLRGRGADKDVVDYYGTDNVVTICGKAGFGFAEDTFCFHKGTPPTHKDRLILQIEFGLADHYGSLKHGSVRPEPILMRR